MRVILRGLLEGITEGRGKFNIDGEIDGKTVGGGH